MIGDHKNFLRSRCILTEFYLYTASIYYTKSVLKLKVVILDDNVFLLPYVFLQPSEKYTCLKLQVD